MPKSSAMTALFMLAFSGPAPAAEPPKLEPGLWVVRTVSVVNGQAQPEDRQEVCLDDELNDIAGYFTPKLEGVKAQCRTTRQPVKGNTTSHRLQCKGATFTSDVTTSVTIDDSRRFRSSMKVDTRNKQRAPYLATAETEARWAGPCRPR